MLSKQAFNALLKTLEEPPEYLKFIFATTEIKKIPITVVSRCQRFDLARVKSSELFEFIKNVAKKENGKVTEDAIKFIVKISEGSVRDALSLLDRALMSQEKNAELNLPVIQKIFGYFDKSNLIELFKYIFEGNEKKVIEIYRSIYDQGVEPKIFLNDFLEILYYFKNISLINVDSTNFNLNDEEFNNIKKIANEINSETLILFWQFTIKTLEEIEIVSNQHVVIEMFLIRLMYLKGIRKFSNHTDSKENLTKENINEKIENPLEEKIEKNNELFETSNKTIGQIKNIVQEKKQIEKINFKNIDETNIQIKSFDDLINICSLKKEIKLKYELETNVNLVSFENNRIEISFNDNLDKEFIKNLSNKLYEWTSNRWIISLSKKNGELSKKEKNMELKKELLKKAKKGEIYKKILETFPDAELTDVNGKND